jgi:hypothetical protein
MPSKLDPYKEFLKRRLEQAGDIRLPATVLHREIAEQGFEGSVKLAQRFLAAIKPKPEPQPVIRFETLPGHQLQIDFVVLRRAGRRRYAPSLPSSATHAIRSSSLPTTNRTETLIACLERAFHWFGGVPSHVLCDNPKTIVIERDAYDDGKHRFNSKLLDFAKHCGFSIKLSIAHHKGDRAFALTWPSYVAYAVSNESYALPVKAQEDVGKFVRRLQGSAFQRYIGETTWWAAERYGPQRHWIVGCEHHLIDVISADDPTIELLIGYAPPARTHHASFQR